MKILLVTIIYCILCLMGKVFELPYGYSSPIFIAAGFSIAALLIWGKRAFIGIIIGHIAADFYLSYEHVLSGEIDYKSFFFYPFIACLQAYIGSKIAGRYYNANEPLVRGDAIFKFVFFTAVIPPLITCLVAVSPWMHSLDLTTYNKYTAILMWYIGDAVGIAVGLTAFLMIFDKRNKYFKGRGRLVLAYSTISFLFISLYLVSMVHIEKERRQEDLNSKSMQALYHINNKFIGLQSQLLSIKNFLAASEDVNEVEFQTFGRDIYKNYEGIEFVNVASSEKGYPFIYEAPVGIKNLDDLSPYNNLLKTLEKSTPSLVVVLENELPYFYISMPLLRSVPGKRSKDFTGIIIAKANIVEFIKPVFLFEQGNILKMELSLLEESGSLPLYDTAKSFGYKFSESHFELTKRTINHGRNLEYRFVLDQNYVVSKLSPSFIMSGIVTLLIAILMSCTGLSHAARTMVFDNLLEKKIKNLEDKNFQLVKKSKVQSELVIEVSDGLNQCIKMFKQYYKMLKKEFTKIPFQDELLEMSSIVEKSYEHFQRILEVSKLEVGEIRFMKIPFSTKKLIQDIKTYYQISMQNSEIELKVFKDPSVPDYLVGDKGMLKELIFAYLKGLSNQITHLDVQIYFSLAMKNSESCLRVQIEDIYEADSKNSAPEEIISYADLSEEKIEKLRGRNLNLHYCSNLAQEMGGEVFFGRKNQKRNRAFILELPIGVHYDETGYGKLLKGMEKRLMNLSHIKVLLIDDNENDLVAFQHFFDKMNINYIAQSSFDSVYDIADKFDVIFINLELSQGKNIQHENVVAILANKEELESDKYINNHFSDYLVKPVHLSDMIGVLGKFSTKRS